LQRLTELHSAGKDNEQNNMNLQ